VLAFDAMGSQPPSGKVALTRHWPRDRFQLQREYGGRRRSARWPPLRRDGRSQRSSWFKSDVTAACELQTGAGGPDWSPPAGRGLKRCADRRMRRPPPPCRRCSRRRRRATQSRDVASTERMQWPRMLLRL
jgi:hypothetical protein